MLTSILLFLVAALAYGAPFFTVVETEGASTIYNGLLYGPFGSDLVEPTFLVNFDALQAEEDSTRESLTDISGRLMTIAQICGLVTLGFAVFNLILTVGKNASVLVVLIPGLMTLLSIAVYAIYFGSQYNNIQNIECTQNGVECDFMTLKQGTTTVYLVHASIFASFAVTPLSIIAYNVGTAIRQEEEYSKQVMSY